MRGIKMYARGGNARQFHPLQSFCAGNLELCERKLPIGVVSFNVDKPETRLVVEDLRAVNSRY